MKTLNIFYQAGTSKTGNPVFYYVARRYELTVQLWLWFSLIKTEGTGLWDVNMRPSVVVLSTRLEGATLMINFFISLSCRYF